MTILDLQFAPDVEVDPKILLLPQIPKPLHGLNPRTIFGKKWWDDQRTSVYISQGYKCKACGVHRHDAKYHTWLEAHEVYEYNYKKGVGLFVGIVALCHSCHNFIHQGRLQSLCDSYEICSEKYFDIISHGNKVLRDAGLTYDIPLIPSEDICQDWEKWHLVIKGKKYYSKFKSHLDWENRYR